MIDDLKKRLSAKEDLAVLTAGVIDDPSLIEELLAIISTDKGGVKFRSSKLIRLVSEKRPDLVMPHFRQLVGLLDSTNHFILWDAILIIGNLSAADPGHLFDAIYEQYFKLLEDSSMITAANIIGASEKIIQNRPEFAADITRRLLLVPAYVYLYRGEPSPECNNVLCGQVIDFFEKIYRQSAMPAEIIDFIRQQLHNSRGQVVRKAEKFLQKFASDR